MPRLRRWDGGRWRRLAARLGGPPAADPEPPLDPARGQRHRLPRRALPLLRDVVWCLPVGTGVVSLLPHPCRTAGSFHPAEAQIRQVHARGHLPDGPSRAVSCRDLNKCCHCGGLPSCWEGDGPLCGPDFGSGTDLLRGGDFLLTDFGHSLAPPQPWKATGGASPGNRGRGDSRG